MIESLGWPATGHWYSPCLLLQLPCPTRQHTQIPCSSHTNLLSVPWVYNVTSHLIISPCNILFSTPKFPLVNSYVSVKSEVTQKSLPSLTTHLPISSHSTKHFAPESIPWWRDYLCDHLIHVYLRHHITISSKRIVTVLLKKEMQYML